MAAAADPERAKSRPRWSASLRWMKRGTARNAGRVAGTAALPKPDAASVGRARFLPWRS